MKKTVNSFVVAVSNISGCKLRQMKWPGNRPPNWRPSLGF